MAVAPGDGSVPATGVRKSQGYNAARSDSASTGGASNAAATLSVAARCPRGDWRRLRSPQVGLSSCAFRLDNHGESETHGGLLILRRAVSG